MSPPVHVVRVRADGGIVVAVCSCGWRAAGGDRAVIVRAAAYHPGAPVRGRAVPPV